MKRLNTTSIYAAIVIIGFLLSITACQKTKSPNQNNETPDSFEELVVDKDFKFKTTRTIDVNINIISNYNVPHILTIYEGDPEVELRTLNKGLANEQLEYSATVRIPTYREFIYVQCDAPGSTNDLAKIDIKGAQEINHTFDETKKAALYKSVEATMGDPGCGSNCDETLSGNHNNLDINSGNTYCIDQGSSVTVNNLRFKGGVLIVCGNLTANNISGQGQGGGGLLISGPGNLTATNINFNKIDSLVSYGTVQSNNNLTLKNGSSWKNYGIVNIIGMNLESDEFYNDGDFNIGGNYNNNNGTLTNQSNGIFSVGGNFNNNESGVNYGTIEVGGSFHNNGNGEFENYCKLDVGGDFHQNGSIHNHDYIKVDGQSYIQGNQPLYMYAGALIETNNLTLNSDIIGSENGCARINIEQTTTINGGADVTNNMDFCDADGIETNNGNLGPDVTFCECFVPQTACNPGAGQQQLQDDDGDGVPNDQDEYPNDPDRAFNAYDFSSVSFEDLWPSLGDYDYNDLTMTCDYQIVTNADNEVVDLICDFKIEATGAGLNNGFGFSLPVDPSNVASVSGYEHQSNWIDLHENGYENGHPDNTVVIVYDEINSMLGGGMYNTIPGGKTTETDTTTVTITFSNPPESIGTAPYNPFMIIDEERGKEVHLIDNEPTALVDETYFGTSHDDSQPDEGRYYVTENNLPWAIEIPVKFDYPIEKADILQTYLKFADWALSNGQQYPDWYLDENGYRNEDNIYATYE
ncbi:MAG: LruC domain-containing protein [Bacteroidales bacterium]|nr:LruC domain-containing protein [Bacteroidales bacterium]